MTRSTSQLALFLQRQSFGPRNTKVLNIGLVIFKRWSWAWTSVIVLFLSELNTQQERMRYQPGFRKLHIQDSSQGCAFPLKQSPESLSKLLAILPDKHDEFEIEM